MDSRVDIKKINKMSVQSMITILFLSMFFITSSTFVFVRLGLAEGGMSNDFIFSTLEKTESMDEDTVKNYLKELDIPHYDLRDKSELEKVPSEYFKKSNSLSKYISTNKNIYYKFNENILVRFPVDLQFVGPFRDLIPFPVLGLLIILFCLTYLHYKHREKSLNKTLIREFAKISTLLEMDYKASMDKHNLSFETIEFKEIGDHIYNAKKLIYEKNLQELKYKEQRTKELGELAHDIKTPLTIIQGNLELLLESKDQGEVLKRKARIEKQINRMLEYINRMLLMVRLENYDENKKDIFSISKCTDYLIISIENFLEPCASNYTIYNEIDENSISKLKISYDYIERAVMNLVKNSLENSNSLIEIKFEEQNSSYIINILDSGPGFSKIVLDSINGKDDGSSLNGFGLEFVKRVMEKHGGSLHICNRLEKGASCTLVLPLYE